MNPVTAINSRVPQTRLQSAPRILGTRGTDNEGVVLVWDQPVCLVPGQTGSHIWRVSWEHLSIALNILVAQIAAEEKK